MCITRLYILALNNCIYGVILYAAKLAHLLLLVHCIFVFINFVSSDTFIR